MWCCVGVVWGVVMALCGVLCWRCVGCCDGVVWGAVLALCVALCCVRDGVVLWCLLCVVVWR